MDAIRFGRAIRCIRLHARLRQVDVARRAGLSQAAISDIERGRGDLLSVRTLEAVARAVGADAGLDLRWRGGDVDRLLDRRHAALVGLVVGLLERSDWSVVTEATYSRYGERGSFDVLALHRRSGFALAVEVKTRLLSLEATLRKLDEKTRLAPDVVTDRFEARPRAVGRMLVMPEGGVSRRAIARHDDVLRTAFPVRGPATRSWIAAPTSPAALLLLVTLPAPADASGVASPRISRGTRQGGIAASGTAPRARRAGPAPAPQSPG